MPSWGITDKQCQLCRKEIGTEHTGTFARLPDPTAAGWSAQMTFKKLRGKLSDGRRNVLDTRGSSC